MDADDTILDFQKCEYMAIQKAFNKYKLPFDRTVFSVYKRHNHALWADYEQGKITKSDILNKRFRLTFDELGYRNVPATFEVDYQIYLGEGGYVLEGVEDVLEKLSKECDIYILTNGVSATQRSRLSKSGILHFVKDVFISEELGTQKPHKEFFEEVFKKIGIVDKSQILMIGDSLGSDIQGGVNAGIDTCWLNLSGKESTLPTYEIHSIKELEDLVLQDKDTSRKMVVD